MPLLRKGDGEKWEGPHCASAPPSGDGEGKDRGLAAKMGMQGVRGARSRKRFGASGQRITLPLLAFVCDLLALGQTLKEVSLMTGLNKNVVKAIDRARLSGLYTEGDEDGETRLRKPKRQARYLGADKFKLHNGHKCSTVIIDLKTGHVLWLAHSKKRQVVHEFCDFVLAEWISNVETIACDMNADFERAFLKRFPHLDIVYDRFYLVKNFNEKVTCKVRKDKG